MRSRRCCPVRARLDSPDVSDSNAVWLERDWAASGCSVAFSTLITHKHLLSKVIPDHLVDLVEARIEADFRDVTRAGEIYAVDAFYGRWPGRQHDHAVGQSDRLFKAVGDED